MPLVAFAAHRDLTRALAHALAQAPELGGRRHTGLLAALTINPTTPAGARGHALERLTRPSERHPVPSPPPSLSTLSSDLPSALHAAVPSMTARTVLALVRAAVDVEPVARAVVDAPRATQGIVWGLVWHALILRTDLPGDLTCAVATASAQADPTPHTCARILALAAQDPHLAAHLRTLTLPQDLTTALTAAIDPYPPHTPLAAIAADMVSAASTNGLSQVIARAGQRSNAAALIAVSSTHTTSTTLLDFAEHDGLPPAVHHVVAMRLLTEHHHAGQATFRALFEPGAPRELLLAHQNSPAENWADGEAVITLCAAGPSVADGALAALEGPRPPLGAVDLATTIALHPDLRESQRFRARRQLDTFGPDGHAGIAASLALPDLSRAGALLPVGPYLRSGAARGPAHGAAPLIDGALRALLPTVTTAAYASALVALAPTFTGTVGELFAVSAALSH